MAKKLLIGMMLFFFCTVSEKPLTMAQQPKSDFIIGVLAKRGYQKCLKKWKNTAYYLNIWVSGCSFSILPLDFQEIEDAVKSKKIDFLLANPAIYAEMENKYGLSRIATLKNGRLSKITTVFGGVIFCRADRNDISKIADLKDKNFMAVSQTSFGGWYAAWKYLLDHDLDPFHNFSKLYFGQTHDAVVLSIRDGGADAGTVRTDILERMVEEGKISLKDFKILDAKTSGGDGFPFLHTTELYPEWPFAKLAHVPSRVAEKVAVALLKMEPDVAAARDAKCAGWTIPLSYESIHRCLKALKVGPYKDLGKINIWKILEEYRLAFGILLISFILLSFSAIYLKRLNHQHKDTIEKLKESEQKGKIMYAQLLNSQKLEAVGQLSAGLAHEINTPAQYVGTNIDFLQEAFEEVDELIEAFERMYQEAKNGNVNKKTISQIDTSIQDMDWEYLKNDIFDAISQSKEGINKIAAIINAMKAFSTPPSKEMEYRDLNEIISTTLEVCKHQWSGIAKVETTFDKTLEKIPCYSSELGQVFLNMLANAAYAIEERLKKNEDGYTGIIRVTTNKEGDHALIKIEDNGVGIPDDIINKIFDPFFTTKEVGEGTGQGLTICFDAIIKKHGGKITVTSKQAKGTTFCIYLPTQTTKQKVEQYDETLESRLTMAA